MNEARGDVAPRQSEFDGPAGGREAPRTAVRAWRFRALGLGAAGVVYALLGSAEMARGGFVLNLVGVVLITLFTVLVGPWALGLVIR
jgi:hypothetical protein